MLLFVLIMEISVLLRRAQGAADVEVSDRPEPGTATAARPSSPGDAGTAGDGPTAAGPLALARAGGPIVVPNTTWAPADPTAYGGQPPTIDHLARARARRTSRTTPAGARWTSSPRRPTTSSTTSAPTASGRCSPGLACCAMEMMSAATSVNDMDRFNMFPFRASPRQADVLIVAGTLTTKMAGPLVRLWEQMPEPKWCVAMGDCTCSGGRYKRSYATVEGIDRLMPVDVYVPGCPPRPEGLIYGMLKLQQLILERRGHWPERRVGPTVPAASRAGRGSPSHGHRAAAPPRGPPGRAPARARRAHARDTIELVRRRRRRARPSCARCATTPRCASRSSPTSAAWTPASRCRSSTTSGRRSARTGCASSPTGSPRDDPRVPSITFLWSGAEWAEREAYDMFGIDLRGQPRPAPHLHAARLPGLPAAQGLPARRRRRRARRARASAPWSTPQLPAEMRAGPRCARARHGAVIGPDGQRLRSARAACGVAAPGTPHVPAGGAVQPMTTTARVRSLDDPDILVQTPATIYDAIPPLPPRTEREAEFYTLGDGEMLINLGPAAPLHPRRAAGRAQDRRRAHRRPRPRARLPPSRRREDLRERRLASRHQQLRPARVHRLDVQRGAARPDRREAARPRGAAPRGVHPRPRLGAQPHLQPRPLHRLAGPRPGRPDAHPLRLHRARRDRRDAGRPDGPEAALQLPAHRRRQRRPQPRVPEPPGRLDEPRRQRTSTSRHTLINENEIFVNRTKGLGVIDRETALRLCLSGPPLRATGVPYDVRRAHPYSVYPELEFEIPTRTDGDSYARYLLHIEEIKQRCTSSTRSSTSMPDGPVMAKLPRLLRVPPGTRLRGPREPARPVRRATPSATARTSPSASASTTPRTSTCRPSGLLTPGHLVADIMAIMASLDPIMGGIDK